MKTINKGAEGATIKRIEYIVISYKTENGKAIKLPKSVIHYAVEMAKADKTSEIIVTPEGALVKE
jgi:hypothetical protein